MMKMGKTTDPNSMKGMPAKGVVVPKDAGKADMSGERKESMRGGVAMGKEDMGGKNCEFNTGKTAGICYEHKRSAYGEEDNYEKDRM